MNLTVLLSQNIFVSNLLKTLTGGLFLVFIVFILGYMLGKINIKGVSLGSSGVFITALIAGVILFLWSDKLGFENLIKKTITVTTSEDGTVTDTVKTVAFTVAGKSFIDTVRNMGLALFVTSIGLIAGPTFFRNFKKKALAYITVGVIISVMGMITCIILVKADKNLDAAGALGLLMGALTSTPGLAAVKDAFGDNATITAMSGLAYPFGVLGVVLFVQIVPKIMRADMDKEIAKMRSALSGAKDIEETHAESQPLVKVPAKKRITFDSFGFWIFFVAVALGTLLGALTIPFSKSAKFSLGTTGGALLVGLLFGHFKHVGRVSLEVPGTTLKSMRELGLIMFLAGSGIEGGLAFLAVAKWQFFIYGMIMTLVPMLVGFIFTKFVFKLELLNNMGCICGGMTSTPALGALIHFSKTDDVGQAYAATYPIALLVLVFVPQIVALIC